MSDRSDQSDESDPFDLPYSALVQLHGYCSRNQTKNP
jgi:hypothetical protein